MSIATICALFQSNAYPVYCKVQGVADPTLIPLRVKVKLTRVGQWKEVCPLTGRELLSSGSLRSHSGRLWELQIKNESLQCVQNAMGTWVMHI